MVNCKRCLHAAAVHENGVGKCHGTVDDPREDGSVPLGQVYDCFCTEFVPNCETYPKSELPTLYRYRLYVDGVAREGFAMLSERAAKMLNDGCKANPPNGLSREYRRE